MTISELIKELEAKREQHGDVEVVVYGYNGGDDVPMDIAGASYRDYDRCVVLDKEYR